MKIHGQDYRTIWLDQQDSNSVCIIDQLVLPHQFEIIKITSVQAMARAISDMNVRGAGLIGASAAWGCYLAMLESTADDWQSFLKQSASQLIATRPTAANLAWAVTRQLTVALQCTQRNQAIEACLVEASTIADEDAEACRSIGQHGLGIIRQIAASKAGAPVNILTHCNAGCLAFVDYGSATGPIYAAFDAGIPIHIWVDETRPRNQGASLTAWELGQHGVPHSLIADNVGGHLMQHGMVDLVITGADRVTRNGDCANKIGTYLKALAAKDNHVPFYVALPSSTFDFTMSDGVASIPIEERSAQELRFISGKTAQGKIETVQICPDSSPGRNWGFDVTPARLITGLISERGICSASLAGISQLYSEYCHE